MSKIDGIVDPPKKQCKVCGEIKVRYCYGKSKNGTKLLCVDENDKLWSGKVCPKCKLKAHAVYMRERRNNKNKLNNT